MKKSMIPNRNILAAVLCLLLSFVYLDSSAQSYVGRINTYTPSTFSSSYTTIVGNGETSVSGAVDDGYGTFSMPFPFNYDNINMTGSTVVMASNGLVLFNNYQNGCCSNYLGNSSFYSALVPYSTDMYVTGKMCYLVTGSAPNRVLTMEWYGFQNYSGATINFNMQVKIYETTNYIEFLYSALGSTTTTSTGYVAGVGLNGSNSPSFIYTTYQTGLATPSSHIRYKTPAPNVQLSASPEYMDFGQQLTGNATQGIVNVTHAGTEQTLVISNAAISGANAPDFTIISGPPNGTILSVGQTVTYTVQFVPSFGGTRNALFTVVTNGRDSGTQATSMTGFGVAPRIQVTPTELFKRSKVLVNDTVEQSIIISSIGAANLFFTNYPNSFTFSGDFPGDYVVSKRPPNPLPAGGTDTLKIKFIPKAEGGRPATVNINSNAENGSSIPVLLKGIGIVPRITIAPSFLDFDSTAVGSTQCQKITIYNPGSDLLTLKNHYFASSDGDFSFTPLVGSQLVVLPNDSAKVDVCFTPLQKGTRQARFRVLGKIPMTIEQFPRDTSAVDVEIRGNATPLDLSIIAMKDITDAIVGTDAVTTLELSNVGTDPIVVNAPVLSGANASEFTVSKVVFPATVAPGSSISMTVTAKPLARGERTANIKFNLTSEGRPYSVNADVKATALVASASCVSSAVTFDKLLLGESITKIVELTNTGDINQTFTATLTGSDAFSVDNTAIEVLAGAKGTYTVTFAPTAEGKATGSLTIKGAHIADMTVALNGTGEKKEEVTQSVGKVSQMDGFSLEQNAPNPAVGYTNFSFTAPKQSTVRLYLADMSGKVVKEIANSNYSGGKHSISMDTKELASGSYVYILESGATRIMRQMIVTK
jgi:hypothetical protein